MINYNETLKKIKEIKEEQKTLFSIKMEEALNKLLVEGSNASNKTRKD